MNFFHGKGWNFYHEILSKGSLLGHVLGYMPERRKNILGKKHSK